VHLVAAVVEMLGQVIRILILEMVCHLHDYEIF
jgi:hypothetical protein